MHLRYTRPCLKPVKRRQHKDLGLYTVCIQMACQERADQEQKGKAVVPKATKRRVVSFQLPEPQYRALEDDALHRGLKSLHQRGREIVVEHLCGMDAAETNERIAALEQEVAGLKEDIAHVLKLLRRVGFAVVLGSGKSESEASDWVRDHMPKRS